MPNPSDAISSRINEMRHVYIEANNRIVEKMEAAINDFKGNNEGEAPEISGYVKMYLDSRIKHIREMVVDHIGFGISKLKSLYIPADNEGLKSRRFSRAVTDALEQSFEADQYPSESEKIRLAKICRLSTKQINNWFTNKRNRTKSYEGSR